MSTRSGRRANPHSAVLWIAVVALAAAAIPSHAWWMETQLAGIRLGDNAMILLDIPGYGQPDGIIVATSTTADRASVPGAEGGQGPGLLGAGGAGAAGPGGAGMMGAGAAGMMGPGGGGMMGSGPAMMGGGGMGPGMARGSTRGIPSAVAPVTPVQMAMTMAAPMGSMGGGGGMAMSPGQMAAGATGPMAGAGGMMGGQPGMMGGAGPGAGMMGMPGMAGAGAGAAGAGGFGPAQGVSDFPDWVMAIWFDLHEDEIEWFYMRDKCAVGFVINKNSGKIVAISVAGERCDFARTAMGRPHETVKLGDDFKRVLQRYMWPHALETFTGTGSSVLTNFGEGTSVSFAGVTNNFRRDAILWYHEVRGLKQGNVAFTLHDMKVTRMHIWDPDPS